VGLNGGVGVVKNKKVGCKFAISFILLIFAAKY